MASCFLYKRRELILALGGAAAWPLAARAQQREFMRRISVVNVIAETDLEASPRIAVLKLPYVKLGWTTERDFRIDYYWDTRDIARTRAVATQVVATRPDLIVSVTTPPTQALR